MKKELTVTGKSVEEAVASGAEQLGVDVSELEYEVLEAAKKGFLGFGEALAKVKITYDPSPEKCALDFVRTVISDMGLDAVATLSKMSEGKREYLIDISGNDAGSLIGHHGETLDSLQYLTNLAANRREEDDQGGNYTRITVDIENYRSKREQTLRRLAKRMAEKAIKYRKNVSLEPMNAYERRIIHSEVQGIKGVSTSSVGSDNNRRVVIYVDQELLRPSPAPVAPKPKVPAFTRTYPAPVNKIQKRARFDDSLPEYTLGQYFKDGATLESEENESEKN